MSIFAFDFSLKLIYICIFSCIYLIKILTLHLNPLHKWNHRWFYRRNCVAKGARFNGWWFHLRKHSCLHWCHIPACNFGTEKCVFYVLEFYHLGSLISLLKCFETCFWCILSHTWWSTLICKCIFNLTILSYLFDHFFYFGWPSSIIFSLSNFMYPILFIIFMMFYAGNYYRFIFTL